MSMINRRKFLKKAIRKCLPILGVLVATSLPIKADTIPNGCKDNCSNSCQRRCSYTCHLAAVRDACIRVQMDVHTKNVLEKHIALR